MVSANAKKRVLGDLVGVLGDLIGILLSGRS